MLMVCQGCRAVIRTEDKEPHYYLCLDAPFILTPQLQERFRRYERMENQFVELRDSDDNPYLYKNLMPAENIQLADLPCTGCRTATEHSNGDCVYDCNVKNFEAQHSVLRDALLSKYSQILNRAQRKYNSNARRLRAFAYQQSPGLTPEIVARLINTQDIAPEYQRSMQLLRMAQRIPVLAARRKELSLERKRAFLNERFEDALHCLGLKNTLFLVESFRDGKLDIDMDILRTMMQGLIQNETA